MRKIVQIVAVAAMVLTGMTACQKTDPDQKMSAEEKALKEVVEQYVPKVIYEIYGKLADETQTLCSQLTALRDAKNLSQADIDKACATFLSARAY